MTDAERRTADLIAQSQALHAEVVEQAKSLTRDSARLSRMTADFPQGRSALA